MIRKAVEADLPAVCSIYDRIHTCEQLGITHTGWQRGVYPTRETARAALNRGELYVYEDGAVLACAVINQMQTAEYAQGNWQFETEQVLVLHTLSVHPDFFAHGIGTKLIDFYEALARSMGCRAVRMDTNAINLTARKFYRRLGYREAGVVPCTFQGIPGVSLVLLEKKL